MNELQALGDRYGTDKAQLHRYTDLYHMLFSQLRQDPLTFVEIGLFKYASMLMWQDYFPNAKLIGIDNEMRQPQPQFKPNVTLIECDAADSNVLQRLRSMDVNEIDVLIDDGSHMSKDHVATFGLLYPLVKPGGLYIIEDTHVQHKTWREYQKFNDGINTLEWLRAQAPVPHGSVLFHSSNAFQHMFPSVVVIKKPLNTQTVT